MNGEIYRVEVSKEPAHEEDTRTYFHRLICCALLRAEPFEELFAARVVAPGGPSRAKKAPEGDTPA